MKRFTLWIAAGCLALLQACSAGQPKQPADEAKGSQEAATTATAGDGCTVVMKVDGMVCNAGCPPVVKKTLMSVAGVDQVEVSYETSLATVQASKWMWHRGEAAMVEALKVKQYTATIQAEKKADEQGNPLSKAPHHVGVQRRPNLSSIPSILQTHTRYTAANPYRKAADNRGFDGSSARNEARVSVESAPTFPQRPVG